MKTMRGLILGGAILVAPMVAQAVPVFSNASFESNTAGWSFSGGSQIYTSGSGFDGTKWAWVGRRDASSALIAQTVGGFTVGATYDLTFLLGTESFNYNGGLGDTVNVAIIGAGSINQDFTQSNGTGCCWNLWEQQTYTFVADAASLTFQVHGYSDGSFGHLSADAGVDRFALTEVSQSVPEPASLVLLGMGLAGLGFARRRRTR